MNYKNKFRNYLYKIENLISEYGLYNLIKIEKEKIFNYFYNYTNLLLFKIFRSSNYFTIQEKKYKYFYHRYNNTWKNERSVEIPIIMEYIKECDNKEILEVGNVLSHYFRINHDIVDKHEKADIVINQDIVGYHPSKRYDLIISISTLEHVGLDETPPNPKRFLVAIANLKSILKPKGKIIMTLPIGFNQGINDILKSGLVDFSKKWYLKRISFSSWKEVKWEGFYHLKYGTPFPNANGLFIGIISSIIF